MEEYLSLLNGSYAEAVDVLWDRYGHATDDYYSEKSYNRFKAGEIKTPSKKKITRTSEGLYIHHVDEDKQILISTAMAIKAFDIPFEYQKKERLVYCDLIEHAILHLLISKESIEKDTVGEDGQRFGVGGYVNFIRPELVQWLVDDIELRIPWKINCRNKVMMDKEQARELIELMDKFLIDHYPINQKQIDLAYLQYVNQFA